MKTWKVGSSGSDEMFGDFTEYQEGIPYGFIGFIGPKDGTEIMAYVRTAKLLGGLAIAVAHASILPAQTWYNPDINSAYPATQSEAGLPTYSPSPLEAARSSAWETPATATWSGSIDAGATAAANAAAAASRPVALPPTTPLAGAPANYGGGAALPSYAAVPTPVAQQVSATLPAPSATLPSSPATAVAPQDTRVAYLPGSDGSAGAPAVGPAILGGGYVDPVLGWGNASNAACNVAGAAAADQCNHGVFFRWDRLYFTMTDPNIRAIGDPTQAGVGVSNGITYPFINSLDTGFIGGPEFGDRIEFGFIDPKQRNGWVASVLLLDRADSTSLMGGALLFNDPSGMLLGFQDANGDNIDDDLNGNNVYGRFGIDLGTGAGGGVFNPPMDGNPDATAPQDNGDLVSWIPIFDELTASSYTDVSGLEISYVHGRPTSSPSSSAVNFLLGVRYLDIDDRFHVVGRGGIYDETDLRTASQNLVIGPQVGMVMARSIGPWAFAGELRYVPGVNFIKGRQRGTFASNAATTAGQSNFNRPLNLHSFAVANNFEDETFSNVIEWRIDSSYALTDFLAIRAGYTGMFLSEIQRGTGNLVYTLPGLGFASANGEDMTLHALTLGLEFYR
jgi:hypothetical protein